MSIPFIEGLGLALGLLIALGPKDTYVIKNSIRAGNALALVLICSISDILLILLGVWGLGALITENPLLLLVTMTGSIAYLVFFGCQALMGAIKGVEIVAEQPHFNAARSAVIKGALFHSLLTPYAWLDTVFVIGTISTTKEGIVKAAFAGGAMSASFFWFSFLTIGSRLAAPLFRNKQMWRGLDAIVAVSMFLLATKLAAGILW
ncbi:LysE/ArgO family amino acid transporter (plasmid) [Agrobacterium sp. rho-13.3]|uniref:LysE/ArgO family amino acid transporter n=1 Tax=Agrobacterium sp. rho-13.3 TaxID=3072980 RepID=UPI002A0D220B|nr:LysE family transporter [Agrobacterium sp. rho-13.3]MDX8310271.1 LysE family transporter [Agrobacterium sp. rho-13.3]